ERLSSAITTDCIQYNPGQTATLTGVITSLSGNFIFENLTAQIHIKDPGGAIIATETRAILSLMPGASFTFTTVWNTSAHPKGTYNGTLEVLSDQTVVSSSTTNFEIVGSSNTGGGLIGTLTATPSPVYQGRDETLVYTITNKGNEAMSGLTVSVIIADSDTGEAKQTFAAGADIPINTTVTTNMTASTTNLPPKIYLVIVQVTSDTLTQPKTLSSATFEVLPSLEVTKTIADHTNLLVWVNDNCPSKCEQYRERHCEHGETASGEGGGDHCHHDKGHVDHDCDHHGECEDDDHRDDPCSGKDGHWEDDCDGEGDRDDDGCDGREECHDKQCIRVDLLKSILDEAVTSYYIVYDRKEFEKELRNPYYTDILILGDHKSLEDHYDEELREKVYSGTGLISSLWLRHGHGKDDDDKSDDWKGSTLFGVRYKGKLSNKYPVVQTVESPISAEGAIAATGKARRVETADDTTIAATIGGKHGDAYPAIILNDYGVGKTIYCAFDLGLSLNDDTYEQIAALIKDSIAYVHRSEATTVYAPYRFIPVELTVKSLGGSLDVQITETFPERLDLYCPILGEWITESPWTITMHLEPDETGTIAFYALAPDMPETYTLETEIGFLTGETYTFFENVSLDVEVGTDTATRMEDVIAELSALSIAHKEESKVKKVIKHLEKVQERTITTKKDIKKNIHDILKAIKYLFDIKSVDIADIRLMLDTLMRIEQGRYYFFVPPE
ncbi:MAG: hypothetical protein ABIF87_17420, partial [Pseudomonadota bacterium]